MPYSPQDICKRVIGGKVGSVGCAISLDNDCKETVRDRGPKLALEECFGLRTSWRVD